MTLAQLESDLRAANERTVTLMKDIGAKCDAHTTLVDGKPVQTGRVWNAEERGQIEASVKEAEAIAAKIDVLKGDAALVGRLDALRQRAILGAADPASPILQPNRRGLSLGQQWAASPAAEFFKSGGHRRGGTWASPSQELDMFATTLTESAGSGGALLVPQYLPGIMPLLFKRLVVADLIAPGTTTSNSIVYMKETAFTNAATPVAEGAAKPESALTFAQVTELVSKIAHWLPVTEEMLEDVAAISSYIDARLRVGVALAEEDQLLNGNGTPPNLLGLLNRAGLATAVVTTAPDTNADAIFKQMAAIATTSFVPPDGIVINPTNWSTILLSKTTTGEYIAGGPFTPSMPTSLWGLNVSPTPSIVLGTALVGAFSTQSQFFRRGLRVEASNSHQDFFIKNLVAIRAEERGALAVYRPGAFGKVTSLT